MIRNFVFALVCFTTLAPAFSQQKRYELLLRSGTIHAGDLKTGFQADVAISDGKIVAIGTSLGPAEVVLDCEGMIVCPGFIDLHTHSDGPIVQRDTRANINYLLQGCTTSVTGNCGSGPTDVGKYLNDIDRDGAGTNVIHLLPHGSLRDRVMGKVDRLPSSEELQSMKSLADAAMLDGAFGMSTGLIYIPGTFAKTEELIEIAKVVSAHGGIYASHIRNEGTQLLDSIQEASRIGKEANLPVHVSHFKASGKPAWGSLHLAAAYIEKMRADGLQMTADQYPYSASSTSLEATLLPNWAREGGRESLEKRLQDAASLERMRTAIQKSLDATYKILIATCKHRPDWVGLTLDQIAANEKCQPIDVVIQIEKNGGASVVNFGMNEEDVRLGMKYPWVATASDGGAKVPTSSQPHPRSYGTFPRKIGRYAIEEGVISLEFAIHSASSLPADILGLSDRGRLREGYVADIAVFDSKTFRDQATYEQPYRSPTGMKYVLVSGKMAIYEGQPTGILAGRAIRKTSRKKVADSSQSNKAWAVEKIVNLIKEQPRKSGPDFSSQESRFASINMAAYEKSNSTLPIGIFDSGIGGLTVLEAILACDMHDNQTGKPGADGIPDFQNESFIYLGDQANMPYGNYPEKGKEDFLRELILKDSIFLLGNRYWQDADATRPSFDKPPVKAIVIACNTATAFGLEDLRKALSVWNLPLITVGVVEAGSNAVMDLLQNDSNSAVAIMATTGTCSSGAYPRTIAQTAGRRGKLVPVITQQGSIGLAGAIEGDPAFVVDSSSSSSSVEYRGPTYSKRDAPIDARLIRQYGFDMQHILGDPADVKSWRLNSIENYIRYEVTTLVENHKKSHGNSTIPIQYVVLGCTHFPFESKKIVEAFSKLRNFVDDTGGMPYRPWISETIEIVDPAKLTARDLFRQLFLQQTRNRGEKASSHRLFISVPNRDFVTKDQTEGNWLTYDFKYGRSAGVPEIEYTRVVPMKKEILPAASMKLLQSYAPNVFSLLQ